VNYSFYFFISLILIVFRSTLALFLPFELNFYDPLIPIVIYTALLRPAREGGIVAIVLGLAMDTLSGGPFGLYLTVYFWLFFFVRRIIRFLRMGSSAIVPMVVVGGVILQNTIILGCHVITHRFWPLDTIAVRAVSAQLLWALFTGPLFLMGIGLAHRLWRQWIVQMLMLKQNGHL
jgi:rod shape-determining protein MreD